MSQRSSSIYPQRRRPARSCRLARALSVDVADLLRTGEADYASAGDSLPAGDNEALADWLNSHPKVLQRPIVVDNDSGRAIIGRPPENVLELLKA